MPVPRQEHELSCICVLGVRFWLGLFLRFFYWILKLFRQWELLYSHLNITTFFINRFLNIFLSTHMFLSAVDETSMFIKPLNVDQCYMFFFGGGNKSHNLW